MPNPESLLFLFHCQKPRFARHTFGAVYKRNHTPDINWEPLLTCKCLIMNGLRVQGISQGAIGVCTGSTGSNEFSPLNKNVKNDELHLQSLQIIN